MTKRLADWTSIVAGPLVVAWLYMFVLDCPDEPRDYWWISLFVILATVATIGIGHLVHRFVARRRRAIVVSTVAAELLYVVSLTIIGTVDGTWFPLVGAVIMAVFALPMAIGIAWGTGRLRGGRDSTTEAPT